PSGGDPEGESNGRRPRSWLATVIPGGSGDPPAGHYDLAAGEPAARAPVDNAGDGSAGPGAAKTP
ncbi:MAG: hypothetical protein ACJ8F3_17095, partial [Xanthobacteraceae bacterium]